MIRLSLNLCRGFFGECWDLRSECPGRFFQIELEPVQPADRVEAVPRLADRETDLLVVGIVITGATTGGALQPDSTSADAPALFAVSTHPSLTACAFYSSTARREASRGAAVKRVTRFTEGNTQHSSR
jgi:hypothetical protein